MQDVLQGLIRERSRPLTPQPTGQSPRLCTLAGIEAVLFDVYGTLFISGSGDIGSSSRETRDATFSDALAAVGISYRGSGREGGAPLVAVIEESHKHLRTNGIEFPEVDVVEVWRITLERLTADGRIPSLQPDTMFLQRLAVEYEVRANPVWPMPGTLECLRSLSQAGLPLGIVSNAQFMTRHLFPALLETDCDKLGLCAELCFYSYEHRQAKPGLFLFERARGVLSERGVSAGNVLYLGNDMLNDVYAASQVGFRTALFAGDARSLRLRGDDPRVAGVSPDLVITQLDQLKACLLPADR